MMTYEEPVVEPGDRKGESVSRHPAYAQIAASRVTGHTNLYGSDFDHQAFMTIRIYRSELHRDLSRDWPFAREEYIEVALSEAQWATFVSTPNSGFGVQCTLRYRDRQPVPQLTEPPQRTEQFKGELNATLREAFGHLATLREKIESCKLSGKAREDLLSALRMAEMNFKTNVEFVAKSFGEHLEDTTEHAKIEVSSYIQMALARAGMKHLGSPIAMKALGPGDENASSSGFVEGEVEQSLKATEPE